VNIIREVLFNHIRTTGVLIDQYSIDEVIFFGRTIVLMDDNVDPYDKYIGNKAQ